MNSFNFATLDFTAFEMIVNQLNPKEIFNLALKTNEDVLKRLASRSSRYRSTSLIAFMSTDEMKIGVLFEDAEQDFRISFAEELDPGASFTIITTHRAAQLLKTLKNVQILFNSPIADMVIDLGVLDEAALEELGGFQCYRLAVTGEAENLSSEEVAEVLNDIEAFEEYCIDSDVGHKVLPPVLPSLKLSLKFATGITRTDLLSMAGKVQNIELRESSLTSEDLHEFIKAWFESKECTTATVTVTQKDQEPWDREKVLEGFQHAPWQEWMRDRSVVVARRERPGHLITTQDMAHAADIDRGDQAVGLIGSVLITETRKELFFCAWHNRREIEGMITEYREHLRQTEARINTYPFQVYGNFIRVGLNIADNVHLEACQRDIILRNGLRNTLNDFARYTRSNLDED